MELSPRVNAVLQMIQKKVRQNELMTDVNQQINLVTKIYKQLIFEFAAFSSVHRTFLSRNFLSTFYRQSFVLHQDSLCKVARENLRLCRMITIFTRYRKMYEKYRYDRWGVKHWARYLPVELLNIIDSFV